MFENHLKSLILQNCHSIQTGLHFMEDFSKKFKLTAVAVLVPTISHAFLAIQAPAEEGAPFRQNCTVHVSVLSSALLSLSTATEIAKGHKIKYFSSN